MNLQLLGCAHHSGSSDFRERLTIPASKMADALSEFRTRFPRSEAVLLSTCNRIEIYTASGPDRQPLSASDVATFLADIQELVAEEVLQELFQCRGQEAAHHLFSVAASLDSMVVGEPQILSQVKRAYELARHHDTAGQYIHAAFQRALFVAKRVSNETALHKHRVSVPSVAIREFANQIFESFGGKPVLMIGAGEMAEETLRCLQEEGADSITVINRSAERAASLAERFSATAGDWQLMTDYLVDADLVICATGSENFIIDRQRFELVEKRRHQRPLFMLDLAMPRNVDPSIGDLLGVYLYSVNDLKKACEQSLQKRAKELPRARTIVEDESARFMQDVQNRTTGPVIRRLKERADIVRDAELNRLFGKLDGMEADQKAEIENSFRRVVNKLLHPPLESIRIDQQQVEPPDSLVDALKRLFQLRD